MSEAMPIQVRGSFELCTSMIFSEHLVPGCQVSAWENNGIFMKNRKIECEVCSGQSPLIVAS
jgi:hypothetical protein